MRSLEKIYHNTRGNTQIGLYDTPKLSSKWNHPADAIELKEKCEGSEYTIEIYTDGSKSSSGVGSGIAIFVNKHLTLQLMYKLAEECSNNQAEQLAIVKALEKLQVFRHFQEGQLSAAIHTDSKINLDASANLRNHQNLVEQIREGVRRLEKDNWTIHFTWVKAHNDNFGNELADQLAKKAASRREGETAYSKIPKSAVIKVIQEEGELDWQREWNASTKGEKNKIILPNYRRLEIKKTANGYKTFNVSNRTRNIEIVLP
jgi:ribonuclease HI